MISSRIAYRPSKQTVSKSPTDVCSEVEKRPPGALVPAVLLFIQFDMLSKITCAFCTLFNHTAYALH
jgi:hypothetical protein